jgi:long-subunit fatty acid transport protein
VDYFQPIQIKPEPVGSGARALGQSAFIAVADDATAASWNPAGLRSLETPETSFVGAWRTTTKDYSPAGYNITTGSDHWSGAQINFMSYAQPIVVGNTRMCISVNYHQVYDFGAKLNIAEEFPVPFGPFGPVRVEMVGESEGAVAAYSLAGGLSMPSYPEIAVGASFNWYTQSLFNSYAWQAKTKQTISFSKFPEFAAVFQGTETYDNFRGHNFTFGILWDTYERHGNMLTLGLVYHTPFAANVAYERVVTDVAGDSLTFPRQDLDIYFPPSLGAGANYRISDTLSVAFDVEWKEWSKFEQKDASGGTTSPFNRDTMAYRLGAQHLIFYEGATSVLACRAGLFYEQLPIPIQYGLDPLPVYGPSLGLGWTVREQFSLDFAYQFRRGELDGDNIAYDIREHFLVGSFIKYF